LSDPDPDPDPDPINSKFSDPDPDPSGSGSDPTGSTPIPMHIYQGCSEEKSGRGRRCKGNFFKSWGFIQKIFELEGMHLQNYKSWGGCAVPYPVVATFLISSRIKSDAILSYLLI
jgi:hypothetical protein